MDNLHPIFQQALQPFVTPNHAAACADEYARRLDAEDEFQQRVTDRLALWRASNQGILLAKHCDRDTDALLAEMFTCIALNWNDEAEIGRLMRRIWDNTFRPEAEKLEGGK